MYGYRCEVFGTYNNHSSMFKFILDDIEPYPLPQPVYSLHRICDIYSYNLKGIRSISINSPSYIYPGGQVGQALYTRLGDNAAYIIGFIDSDTRKHGTRLYGTPLLTYSLNNIMEQHDQTTTVNIIVCKSPYEREICNALNALKDKMHINITLVSEYLI